jgi:hypothetical protein
MVSQLCVPATPLQEVGVTVSVCICEPGASDANTPEEVLRRLGRDDLMWTFTDAPFAEVVGAINMLFA